MEIDKSLTLIQSVKSLIDKELPLVSNLANLSRLFFEYFKTYTLLIYNGGQLYMSQHNAHRYLLLPYISNDVQYVLF